MSNAMTPLNHLSKVPFPSLLSTSQRSDTQSEVVLEESKNRLATGLIHNIPENMENSNASDTNGELVNAAVNKSMDIDLPIDEILNTIREFENHSLNDDVESILGQRIDVLEKFLGCPVFSQSCVQFLLENPHSSVYDISVSDLKESAVPVIKKELNNSLKKDMIKACIHRTNQNFQRVCEEYSVDTLVPHKRAEFDKQLERLVTKQLQLIMDAFFNKGINLGSLQEFVGIRSLDFLATPDDFTTYTSGQLPILQLSERRLSTYKRILRKRETNEVKKISTRVKEKMEDFYMNKRDEVKMYKFASERLNIDMSDLSDDIIETIKDEFYKTLDEEKSKKEEDQRQKIADELIAEEAQISSKKSPSKKKKKQGLRQHLPISIPSTSLSQDQLLGAATSSIPSGGKKIENVLNRMIFNLNDSHEVNFHLHHRVARWIEADLSLIKKRFGSPYDQYDDEKLKYMRRCHHLCGIEKILSEEKLTNEYSFSYSIRNNVGAHGRGFYATMCCGDRNPESGIIYVAFNEKTRVIYHAMFEAFSSDKNQIPILNQIQSGIQRCPELEKEDTCSDWEINKRTLFDCDDNKIIMKIGKKPKNRVTFVFEPV